MSALTKNTMLELSTGHLSRMTLDHLEDERLNMSVFIRDEGFMLYAGHYRPGEESPWPEDFPRDLKNCMRFAMANNSEWLMFDADGARVEDLPYYEDGITPDPGTIAEAHAIPVEKFIFDETPTDLRLYKVVDFDRLEDHQLRLAETRVLEDDDFDAPEGCWIGVGSAAIRIRPDAEGIAISVYRNGREDEDAVGYCFVDSADLDPDPAEAPSP